MRLATGRNTISLRVQQTLPETPASRRSPLIRRVSIAPDFGSPCWDGSVDDGLQVTFARIELDVHQTLEDPVGPFEHHLEVISAHGTSPPLDSFKTASKVHGLD